MSKVRQIYGGWHPFPVDAAKRGLNALKSWLLEHCWTEWLENDPSFGGAPNWIRVPIWTWLTGSDIDWRTVKPRRKSNV